MDDKEVFAYIAGIIDGEGSVSVVDYKSHGHKLIIQVSMRSPAKVPKWLYDNFGGTYGEYKQGGHAWGGGYTAKWCLTGFSAIDLLQNIKPYIMEKSEVVELALEFPMVGKHHTITSDVLEARKAICELLQGLNRKSKPRSGKV